MKKNMAVLLCIVILLMMFASCQSNPKIRRLEFAETASFPANLLNVEISVNSELKNIEKQELKVIEIVHSKVTEEEINEYKRIFNMENAQLNQYYLEDDTFYSYEDERRRLKIDKNGTMYYTNYPEFPENYPLNMTDEEAIKIAVDFLEERGLLPDDFKFYGVGNSIVTANNIETIYEKNVIFGRYIDDIPVAGNCHITVGVISSGISSVYLQYRKYGDVKPIRIIEMEKAVENIKNGDNNVSISDDISSGVHIHNPNNILIEEYELVYIENAYDNEQTHVQPCYRFKGVIDDIQGESYDFSALVRAVPDELTYRKSVDSDYKENIN